MKQIKNRMKMRRIMIMIQTAKSKVYRRVFYFVVTSETPTRVAWIDLLYPLKTQFIKGGKF
jgi:hypothetical protein